MVNKSNIDRKMNCEVCQSNDWHFLPMANTGKSITTSGAVIDQPLGKAQCSICGLVQRIKFDYLSISEFYETQYKTYFERVGAEEYDKPRYSAMADWVANSLNGFTPIRIADIGCGRGWMIVELAKHYPTAEFTGIEPSLDNSQAAREIGLNVISARLENVKDNVGQFDLVYSNNVIQHTTSAGGFLHDLTSITAEEGIILLTLPDASIPGNEMMWSDQNFSIAPTHLFRLAESLGLHILCWRKPPDVASLIDKQMIVLAKKPLNLRLRKDSPPKLNIEENIAKRTKYVNAWANLDKILNDRIDKINNIYNFGASMWSYLLRGYCPSYWNKVKACVVDKFTGQFFDKPVIPLDTLPEEDEEIMLVLGINPANQMRLKSRLTQENFTVVTWHDIISR
jgi:SAM-dependent methyltransferase